MIRFFHIRNKDAQQRILPNGGMTVGYQYVDPKDKTKLMLTFARCSQNDKFLKSKSHLICEGRMNKGNFKVVKKQEGQDLFELLIKEANAHDLRCQEARTNRTRVKYNPEVQA